MTDTFILPVEYLDTKHKFKARFERYGFTHRIAVLIDDNTFLFEPDEEGSYRVLNILEEHITTKKVNINLLRAAAEKLANS